MKVKIFWDATEEELQKWIDVEKPVIKSIAEIDIEDMNHYGQVSRGLKTTIFYESRRRDCPL